MFKKIVLFMTMVLLGGNLSFAQDYAPKTLVVYYSRDGHTQQVAQALAKRFAADIERLIDKKKRTGPIGFFSAGKDATAGNSTDIEPLKKNPLDYDLILIGTPSWFSNPTPAVRTFVAKYNLRNKKVGLFGTAHITGVGDCLIKLSKLIYKDKFFQIPMLPLVHKDLNEKDLPVRIDEFYRMFK